jgi:hypothetical protein
LGVLDGPVYDGSNEFDRCRHGRRPISTEDLADESRELAVIHPLRAKRVLDAEAVDVDQEDADLVAATVSPPAGYQHGDQTAHRRHAGRVGPAAAFIDR